MSRCTNYYVSPINMSSINENGLLESKPEVQNTFLRTKFTQTSVNLITKKTFNENLFSKNSPSSPLLTRESFDDRNYFRLPTSPC